ncbi:MAG: hypothetical protein Tp131SUR933471_44 [Prokaryotic dsDNA virus sp.]|nr:MAG: hypothetical protein Tp131SUR933471_44 [Prokaryotic dsDNA virus sp.]|tara:strand:- start:28993 stop:29460 length:468 start_codon:yes stop_codon:yes gene_type:complete
MKDLYHILDKLKGRARSNNITNTVTFGDLAEVDLNKTSIFPIVHITLGPFIFQEQFIEAEIEVMALDIVDENNNQNSFDSFYRNNNLQDVYNTQLAVVNDMQSHLRRGDLYESDNLNLIGGSTAEPFQDLYENKLAGWKVTLPIQFPNNDFSICD